MGSRGAEDVAMATNFGTKIAINWLCVNDSDKAIAYEGGLGNRSTECRYCRYPAPKGRCYDNHVLAFYVWGVHWCHIWWSLSTGLSTALHLVCTTCYVASLICHTKAIARYNYRASRRNYGEFYPTNGNGYL